MPSIRTASVGNRQGPFCFAQELTSGMADDGPFEAGRPPLLLWTPCSLWPFAAQLGGGRMGTGLFVWSPNSFSRRPGLAFVIAGFGRRSLSFDIPNARRGSVMLQR